jgi:hydroxymethylpyrimidine pyrophosphatase-like HAD family hydrolase
MIRLIGIDVDGTLLDSQGEMPPENIEAIHDAVNAGIHVALVTGRSYPWARPVADPLPASISLIVSNGAVERAKDGSTYVRRLLDRRVARAVLDATRPFRHSAALIFDRDAERQIMFETMDWEHPGRRGYWARNQTLIAQAMPLEGALTEDPIQVMFNGDVEAMRQLSIDLRDRSMTRSGDPEGADGCGAQTFAVSLTEYSHRDFSLIDVTSPLATKGRALAWRAAQMGLERDEVMAIGDNYNDLEMLEFAGRPVVMDNSVPGLKERGWPITGHQDRGGLAEAIRRFALDPTQC